MLTKKIQLNDHVQGGGSTSREFLLPPPPSGEPGVGGGPCTLLAGTTWTPLTLDYFFVYINTLIGQTLL